MNFTFVDWTPLDGPQDYENLVKDLIPHPPVCKISTPEKPDARI